MLHLRNVRLSDIVLRNVAGLSSRHGHTGSSQVASDAHDGSDDMDPVSKLKPKDAVERPLTFRLPDLSDLEEKFLKQQVRIILSPDCLKPDHKLGRS